MILKNLTEGKKLSTMYKHPICCFNLYFNVTLYLYPW